MKRFFAFFLLLVALDASGQKVVFSPEWLPQSQFAGYYVAKEKGFYAQEGLDVEIEHFSMESSQDVFDKLISGKTDFISHHLLQAMETRGDGYPIVNVLQLSQTGGLMCVFKDSVDLNKAKGMKIGRWKVGFAQLADILEYKNGTPVKWVPFLNGINIFTSGALDGMLAFSFSEYIQLQLSLGDIPEENVIRFKDYSFDPPGDGVYTTEEFYENHPDIVEKFVRATKKGWDYARDNRDEAVSYVMEYAEKENYPTNKVLQRRMLDEIFVIQTNPDSGKIDYAPVKEEIFNEMEYLLEVTGHLFGIIDYKEMIK